MALTFLERLLHLARFRVRMLRFAFTVKPVVGGEDPPEGDPPKDPPEGDPADPPEGDPPKVTPDDDWKAKSRKNETRAKKAERELAETQARLKEIEESNQSETEKAIAKAREEASAEARKEAEKDRRSDKLEVSVTRLSTKGFELKTGDGDEAKTETVRFADPDDAQVHIERAIDKGDLDAADIFDEDGKVQTDALTTALADILDRKPHLRASENGKSRPKAGAADAGKGSPAKTDLEAMSVDDHVKRKYAKT